ncbi:uncharacterized protein LOC131179895 [Hevea brasiliensis]|uniref:uncharacterized protein LOC131179895 n=1 Tax=Hevea brasiliensis TaxID=3981 RepID=UPI0025E76C7C|nr:uncharacterized protein LOC131179895 [Hevea brasiliensis]
MPTQAPLQAPIVQPQTLARQYDKLIKYGTTEFKGTVDPLEAEQWLEGMDRVFKKLHCTEELKFKYSVSLLQEDAYAWWKTIPYSLVEPPVLSWDNFLREFRQKYVPDAYVDQKLQEFLSLKQDSKTVAEYEREFSRLSHYAGSLLSTSREKCKRFETGLKPSLRMQVVGFRHNNFSELISQALELERIESEVTPVKEKIEKIEKLEKEKSRKAVDQSSSGATGKKKNFGGTSRDRGRGQGSTSGSQGTVNQKEQGSASVRVYIMRHGKKLKLLTLWPVHSLSLIKMYLYCLIQVLPTPMLVLALLVSLLFRVSKWVLRC